MRKVNLPAGDHYLYLKMDDTASNYYVGNINHMQLSRLPLLDGMIAYYPFNDNAKDESGNEHNGTVYGAVLTADRSGTQTRATTSPTRIIFGASRSRIQRHR